MSADANVARYLGDGKPWPQQRAQLVAENVLRHWDEHGFGWRVIEFDTPAAGEVVGIAMLNYLGDGAAGVSEDELEVGWWLWPAHWGQGYAYEAGTAARDEAFTRLGATSVVARILPANAASQLVAQRIGMHEELTTKGRFGETLLIYRGLNPARVA